MKFKVQVFANGRYIARRAIDLNEKPPKGVEEVEFDRFQICEMLRAVLRSIEPTGRYRLDLTARPEQEEGLPT
jgi:hypothetical protein